MSLEEMVNEAEASNVVEEMVVTEVAVEDPPARKRGRPRIHPVKEVDPNAPKRGRGRPKKVVAE